MINFDLESEYNPFESHPLRALEYNQFTDTLQNDQFYLSKDALLQKIENNHSFTNDFSTNNSQEQKYKNYSLVIPNHNIQPKQPGETKNLPKGFGRQLQNFMKELYKNSKDDELKSLLECTEVQEFLQFQSENFGKHKLEAFINSEPGKLISAEFFGNCRWIYGLAKDNKAKLDLYFKYNTEYFKQAQIAKKRKLN